MRIFEELNRMAEWDADAVVDALDITSEELLSVPDFKQRAIEWIEENNG